MIQKTGISPIIWNTIDFNLLTFVPILLASLLLAWVTIRRTPEYAKGRKVNMIGLCLMAVLSFALYHVFGVSVNLLKSLFLADAFLYASISDYRIRRVPNWVSVIIALLGIFSVSASDLLWNAVTGIAAFGFFFLAAIISKNKIGGADVKFIAACMFVCGLSAGLAGLIFGLLLSVIGTLIRNRKTKSKDKTMQLGRTTFLIGLHFAEKGKESLDDKVKRMIKKDVQDENF